MFDKKIISILSLIILLTTNIMGADVPWDYEVSDNYDIVEVRTEQFYIAEGDAVGIFAYTQETNSVICVGYTIWGATSKTVNVYGEVTATGEGPDLSGNYFLKVWKREYDCILELDYNVVSGSSNFVGNGFESVLKITTPYQNLVNLNAALIDVSDKKCNEEGKIKINTNTITGSFPPFSYSLYNEDNEVISTNTIGTYSGLDTGFYNFEVSDDLGCKQSRAIEISNYTMDISGVEISTTDDFCNQGAEITINPQSIYNTEYPIRFILENQFSMEGFTSMSGSFDDVEAGNYQLTIIDNNACSEGIELSIISDDFNCNEENILAPLSNNPIAHEIVFDCPGSELIILNKQGVLVKSITHDEKIWDGTDIQGNLVENGSYFVYCGSTYLSTVEVIK